MKEYFIYIITNFDRTVLYIGVTNDLIRRVYEHKNHLIENSFSDKYNLGTCIYYEKYNDINQAIDRETQLKKWSRKKKEILINSKNPGWISLVNDNEIMNIDEIIPNVNVDGGFLDSTTFRSK
jgi:putative endonuclease